MKTTIIPVQGAEYCVTEYRDGQIQVEVRAATEAAPWSPVEPGTHLWRTVIAAYRGYPVVVSAA